MKTADPGLRLNSRMDFILKALFIAFPVLCFLSVITQGVGIEFLAIHLVIYAVSLAFFCYLPKTLGTLKFIILHPFLMYSCTIFIYTLVYFKSPDGDLYAPILSSAITLCATVATIAGYFIGNAFSRLFIGHRQSWPDQSFPPAMSVALVCVALPLALMPNLFGETNFTNAVGGAFRPVLWLGLLMNCRSRNALSFHSPIVIGLAALSLAVSISVNGRSFLFAFALTTFIVYLGYTERPITILKLVIAYFASNVLSAFSEAILTTRSLRDNTTAMLEATFSEIFSAHFLLRCLGLREGSDTGGVLNQLERFDQYLVYTFDGRLGISERLTELPHMDIVMSRLPWPVPIDWPEIANVLLSAMPSMGQEKDLIFGDRLVWTYGLMVEGNIGHPLITAPGELYAMGGFLVEFIALAVLMASIVVFFFLSKKIMADDFIASGTLIIMSIFFVFSSTALSAISIPLRIYPITLLIYVFVAAFFRRRARNETPTPPRRGMLDHPHHRAPPERSGDVPLRRKP